MCRSAIAWHACCGRPRRIKADRFFELCVSSLPDGLNTRATSGGVSVIQPRALSLDTLLSRFSVKWRRVRCPLVSIPPFGRGFSRHRGLPIRCVFEEGESEASAAPVIVSMSPLGYPSTWLHASARFRFTWQDHCSSGLVIKCIRSKVSRIRRTCCATTRRMARLANAKMTAAGASVTVSRFVANIFSR
jgi:hypothetical protein